jgi:hypothetical protein
MTGELVLRNQRRIRAIDLRTPAHRAGVTDEILPGGN